MRGKKVGKLIEQFTHALQEWSQRTASSEESIRQIVLVDIGCNDEDEVIEYYLDMIEKRLTVLVEDIHLSERFLIVSLIQDIEHVFEDQLEDARKGENSRQVIYARDVKSRIIEKSTEQERQSPAFQQRLMQFEQFERNIFPTQEKVAKSKLFLDTWREVTTPILYPENVEG